VTKLPSAAEQRRVQWSSIGSIGASVARSHIHTFALQGRQMASVNDPLNQEQKDKFLAWLKEKGAEHPCSACGTNHWTVGDHLLRGDIFQRGGVFNLGGGTYPQAFIVCNNCSHVRTFMALQIGIVEPPLAVDVAEEKLANG
jgi:hypothetical protein